VAFCVSGGRAALQGRVRFVIEPGFSPGALPFISSSRQPLSERAYASAREQAGGTLRLDYCQKTSPPDHTDYTDFRGSKNDPGRRDVALLRLTSSAIKSNLIC
jgi:hypothetical protein